MFFLSFVPVKPLGLSRKTFPPPDVKVAPVPLASTLGVVLPLKIEFLMVNAPAVPDVRLLITAPAVVPPVTVLLTNVQLVNVPMALPVAVETRLTTAPAAPVPAPELVLNVQLVIVSVEVVPAVLVLITAPPRAAAVFEVNSVLLTFIVPPALFEMAPPFPVPPVAALPVNRQSLTVTLNAPALDSPPPPPATLPLEIVSPEIVTGVPVTLKTLTAPPPLTVMLLTPGPTIVMLFATARVLVTVIVPVTENPIVPPVLTSSKACRRLPEPLLLRLVTVVPAVIENDCAFEVVLVAGSNTVTLTLPTRAIKSDAGIIAVN